MNYSAAIWAARLSALLVAGALLYYVSRSIMAYLMRSKALPAVSLRLRDLMPQLRASHPYIGSVIPFTGGYHAYVMWQTHSLSLKVEFGMAVATMVAVMFCLGWTLKLHSAALTVRTVHRWGMVVLLVFLVVHLAVQV